LGSSTEHGNGRSKVVEKPQAAPIDALPSLTNLPNFTSALIFFDLDETIVIPNTTFIDGVHTTGIPIS
jgi:hypothetical protein